jgi:cyclopropane fatty-acyl-phospholipid synthase-like methyltransferase
LGHYADDYAAREALERTIAVRVGDWRELNAEVERLRAVEAAARHLGRCWEQLCRCVDEFAPGDLAACAEWQDALDGAVEATIATLGE